LIKIATGQLRRRLRDEAAPAPPMATDFLERRTEASRRSCTVRPPHVWSYNRAPARSGKEPSVASHLIRRSARGLSCRTPGSIYAGKRVPRSLMNGNVLVQAAMELANEINRNPER